MHSINYLFFSSAILRWRGGAANSQHVNLYYLSKCVKAFRAFLSWYLSFYLLYSCFPSCLSSLLLALMLFSLYCSGLLWGLCGHLVSIRRCSSLLHCYRVCSFLVKRKPTALCLIHRYQRVLQQRAHSPSLTTLFFLVFTPFLMFLRLPQ